MGVKEEIEDDAIYYLYFASKAGISQKMSAFHGKDFTASLLIQVIGVYITVQGVL